MSDDHDETEEELGEPDAVVTLHRLDDRVLANLRDHPLVTKGQDAGEALLEMSIAMRDNGFELEPPV